MITYDEILSGMIARYEELSGTQLHNNSDIMLRLKVLAGEVYKNFVALDFIERQMFVSTASGEYLDKHALFRGLQRKEAKKSKGEVTFSVEIPATSDIVIEQGTIVSTSGEYAVQYTTDSLATLKAGQSSVTVSVTALLGGVNGNAAAGTVVVMVTPVSGITKVTNSNAFYDGADTESDEQLRDRVVESYKDISNGTNAVYYKRLATSVASVTSASVVPRSRGAGTLNVYVKGEDNTSLSSGVISQVQALMDENREINVDVKVYNAIAHNVSFAFELDVEAGYVFSKVKAEIEEKINAYINSLSVGEPALLCDIGDLIYHTLGVKNYEFLDAFCSDVYPKQSEYCVLSSITVKEMG